MLCYVLDAKPFLQPQRILLRDQNSVIMVAMAIRVWLSHKLREMDSKLKVRSVLCYSTV